MKITNVNIRPANGTSQQVYFSTELGKYVANVNLSDESQSTLYSFGKPGDACVTTKKVINQDLMNAVTEMIRKS